MSYKYYQKTAKYQLHDNLVSANYGIGDTSQPHTFQQEWLVSKTNISWLANSFQGPVYSAAVSYAH
jgi:hypothetical protein